jgi:hypothetical protein
MKKQTVFTLRSITIAAFLGGPLAAGVLIYRNFVCFGRRKAAYATLALGIFLIISVIFVLMTMPERLDSIYIKLVIPAFYTTAVTLFAKKYQGHLIEEHLKKGFGKAAWWLTPLFSAAILATVVVIYYASMLSLPFIGYEKIEFLYRNVRLHAQGEIEEKDFEKIAELIKASQFFEGAKGTLFLDKSDHAFELTLLYKDSMYFTDRKNVEGLIFFQNYMNYCFSNRNEIKVVHSDKSFSESFVLEYRNPQKKQFDEKYKDLKVRHIGKIQIYYAQTIPQADIDQLGGTISQLKNYFPENRHVTFALFDRQDEIEFIFNVHSIHWDNKEIMDRIQTVENYINRSKLSKPVQIYLLDLSTYTITPLNCDVEQKSNSL